MPYKDPEKQKQYFRDYDAARAQKRKEHRQTNKAEYTVREKTYRLANKDKISQKQKRYRRENRSDVRARETAYDQTRKGTPIRRFQEYQHGAKQRGIEWKLTFEDFVFWWQQPCFYCDRPIETVGLDRYDSKGCYEETNVVSCCFDCNNDKRNLHGDDYLRQRQEFINEIETNAMATGRM